MSSPCALLSREVGWRLAATLYSEVYMRCCVDLFFSHGCPLLARVTAVDHVLPALM